jgi:hypothetical protein
LGQQEKSNARKGSKKPNRKETTHVVQTETRSHLSKKKAHNDGPHKAKLNQDEKSN